MNALPWLLVHGPVVWQGGLAALVAGSLLVALLRPRRAARRAAAAARDRLGAPAAALVKPSEGMRVTLTGRVVVEEGACQRLDDGGDAAAASAAYALRGREGAWITGLNVRAPRLALAVGEAVVALEGPVEVTVGSREAHRGLPLGRLPRAVQDRVARGFAQGAPHFRDHVTVLRSVAAGDAVRVSGVLRREAPGAEAAGYRGAASHWALVPDGDAAQAAAGAGALGGLRLAFEGAPRFSGPGAGWYARHALGGLLLGALLVGLGGEIAFALAEGARQNLAAGPDTALTETAVAAATPLRRAQAIENLADALDLRHDEDPVLLERRAALHLLHGDCVAAAQALARQGALARGAEMAEGCGDHALAARVFYAEGDFARASAAWAQLAPRRVAPGTPALSEAEARFGVRVHVLAGQLGLAAQQARAFVETLQAQHVRAARPDDEGRAALGTCLADALDARAGDRAARARLQGEPGKPRYPGCALLLADLVSGKDRLELIHGISGFQASARDVPMRWLELLEQEADPTVAPSAEAPRVVGFPSLFVMNASLAVQEMLPAVERALAESTAKDARPDDPRRPARQRAAVLAASFAAATGDVESARRLAERAAADADPDPPGDRIRPEPDPWDSTHAAALRAAVELCGGDLARAGDLLRTGRVPYPETYTLEVEAIHLYRSERSPGRLGFYYPAWFIIEQGGDAALTSAATGDGLALGAWLRRPASEPGSFLRLAAPLVLNGKHDVIQWIRLGYRMPGWFRSTADQLVHWSVLAATAAALGDAPLAAELGERAARFRRAVLDRSTAVPLSVLERL
jgi:hypothetical protein